jgi:hypothetical protein
MLYNVCAHHIKIDIDHATGKMIIGLHCGRMVPVFPERAPATFPVVVLLCCSPCDQLHAARDFALSLVSHQQVNVIGSGDIVQDAQPIAFARLVEPVQPMFAVL